jgi:hypothetical protein
MKIRKALSDWPLKARVLHYTKLERLAREELVAYKPLQNAAVYFQKVLQTFLL